MLKKQEVENILSPIFISDEKKASILPLVNSLKEIPQLIQFLKDENQKIENKIELLSTLITIFKTNEYIIPPFMRIFFFKSKEYNFFEPLIDLYLIQNLKEENQTLLEELFKILLAHIAINKNNLEYVYQKLSLYFTNKKQEILNEQILLKYLKLLNLFYSDVSIANIEKELKNYMYFSGKNSGIKLKLNKFSININHDIPTLENGLSFVLWFYVKKELMKLYYEKDEKNKFNFVEIKISGHSISLVLNDENNIKVVIDDNQSNLINVKGIIKFDDWNNLIFIIIPKSIFKLDINLYINGQNNNSFLPITKEFKANEKISDITLFKNFLGLSTSILFFSFELNTKQIQYFNSLKYGFFKNKLLYEFFSTNDNKYLCNLVSKYKYANQFKVDKSLDLFDFSLKKQTIKGLTCFLCPFTYNKEKNTVDDIFGNFFGEFNENDGINNYKKNTKSIKNLGGMDNLLPIAELMYSSISKSKKIKYNYIDKSILSKNTFLEYFKLIKTILIGKEDNLIDTVKRKFFSSLGLFLEKFPSIVYTNEIIQIFLDIGKETFQMTEKDENIDNFVNIILLNEKIFSKFNIELQIKLWEYIYKFFESDYSQMKDSLNMTKICLFLRYYDENRYNEYCCLEHANLFKSKDNKEKYNPNIMNPGMNKKVEKLFELIQIYIEKIYDEEEIINLYKLLCLDLSPCLQKKIIQVYLLYFQNDKIPNENKKNIFDNFLKNNFLEITEYILCVSLLDVRIEILKLLKLLYDNKELSEIYIKYLNNIKGEGGLQKLHYFIEDNLLPDLINIEIKENEKEQLIKYFNNEVYYKDLDILWNMLSEWLVVKTGHKQKSTNVKANSHITISNTVIEYCLLFASRSYEKYVDLFIAIVFSFFKDETIVNRTLLYDNKYIYLWVIQTIFYYYNKENEEFITDKQILQSIKIQTISFFKEFFSHRRPNEEFMSRANYLMKYSYNLKKILNNDPKKIEETSRITRLLLETLLEIAPKNLNEILNLCSEFILIYNNIEKLSEIKNNIDEELKNLSIVLRNLNINIKEKDISQNVYNSGLMPKYVYDGLNCNILENRKKGTLKEIWKDFSLYDTVIDSYKSYLWGIENLCKKVKIEYTGDPLKLCKKLLKEYGDTKAYRNILKDDIINYLNIKIVEQKDNTFKIIEDDMINIFNINLILLCVAIDITQDEDERNFIIGLYQQFLIYCVMVSINITPNEKCHDYVQEKIYDALGFGVLFLNKKDIFKYEEIKNELLTPFFEEISTDITKKKRTIFTGKKNVFKDTAIVKLFQYIDKEAEFYRASTIHKSGGNLKKDDIRKYKSVSALNIENLEVVFKGDSFKILKNIFDNNAFFEKIEQKYKDNIDIFYKNVYKENGIFEKINNEEKDRIYKTVVKIISLYENQIKDYSNISFLKEKERRNNYKSIKKRLFSWLGLWSDKDLFFNHPEYLKLKLKNHLTKEMTMPLLTPVLDIDYYIPDFSKFDRKKLFNNGDYNYKINLDIDDILRDELDEKIENNKNNNNGKLVEINFIKNNYNFNYLECIYKYTNDKIWEKYIMHFEQKFNFNKIILENKTSLNMVQGSTTISKADEERPIENQYKCCIVRQTHHINGYIYTQTTGIKFCFDPETRKNDTDESLENDPTYDRDMNSCFGSIFKTNKSDKDKINFRIEYEDIKFMFLRYYFYIQSGIEIYSKNNKVYFLNFKTNKDLSEFTNDILNHKNDKFDFREIKADDYKGKKLLGYELIYPNNPNIKIKEFLISTKMQDWQFHNISNLEYLMWLNIYAGRSFNDLTQYPVFPWLITNFSENEIDYKKDYRNLNLPMGMLGISEKGEIRKENYNETYNMVKNELKEMFPDFNYSDFLKKQDDYYESYRNKKKKKVDDKNSDENKLDVNHLPYFYGSHYSNPTYISHYLSRTFPYAFVAIEIQGEKFDDPDRLFLSMNQTFISASSFKDDVRELIPEFFILPEVLINKNNLNLEQGKAGSNNKKPTINDVELPPWSKNNACIFVAEMRRILEKGEFKLNKWIDLIFGSTQRGEKAEENKNIFKAQSYERMVKIDDITDPDSRNALMRLIEIGVTPLQIFASDTKQQMDKKQCLEKSPIYLNAKGNFIYENKKLTCKIIKSNNFYNIRKKFYENEKSNKNKINTLDKNDFGNLRIIKMMQIEHNNIKIYTNTNHWYNIKYSPNSKDLNPEESTPIDIDNNSNIYGNSYKINDSDFPLVIYDNWRLLLKGGFWDGRIEFNNLIFEQKEEIISKSLFNKYGSCITVMELTKNEDYLLCGTKEGLLLSFIINKTKIKIKNNLFIHSKPIISISINDILNMFATSSEDGYIMLYTLPSFDFVRAIYIPSLFKDESEFLYADNVFLSNYPLPSITVYISKKKLFKTFTINGHFMQDLKEEEEINYIKNPIIFTSFDYQDYLIYGTNNGLIKIRKFPEMELVNTVNPFNNGKSIECLCLSLDQKYCFAWCSSNEIAVLSNSFIK